MKRGILKSKSGGFTLIELLIVISIIAVLMAIIMPSLNKARQLAMGIACKGNMKTYTFAVAMYLDDNDGKFSNADTCYFKTTQRLQPGENGVNDWLHLRWCNGDINLKDHPEYGGTLFSYIKNASAFICPTFKRLSRIKSDDQFFQANAASLKHYEPWYNYTQNGYLGEKGKYSVLSMSEVKKPATTFSFTEESSLVDTAYNQSGLNDTYMIPGDTAMIDRWMAAVGNNPKLIIPGPAPEGVGTFYDVIAGFHNAPSGDPLGGRGNCAFLDGHIDAHYRKETFYLAYPK